MHDNGPALIYAEVPEFLIYAKAHEMLWCLSFARSWLSVQALCKKACVT